MNRAALRLGFWASILAATTFLLFTVCFVAILMVNPIFTWTNLSDYIAYRACYGQLYVYIAQGAMLLFGSTYLLILHCLYETASSNQKLWLRTAISFGSIFATLISINYFVQISAVRLNIAQGNVVELEQFLQAKPDSVMAAVNMLGWTIFFGTSSLFAASAFGGSCLSRAIRWTLLASGACCLLAGVAYIWQIVVVIFITINLGMGGAVFVATILLAIYFRRQLLAGRQGDGALA